MKSKRISTTIPEDFHFLKRKYNLSFSEALRIGIAVLLAERGEKDFINPINKLRAELIYKSVCNSNG